MEWIIRIATLFIGNVTPEMRKAICASVNDWQAEAAKTDSPWDDMLVALVKGLLNC